MKLEIKMSDIETVSALAHAIPELVTPYPADEYHQRMKGKESLILVAFMDSNPAGFKAGYDKYGDGSFYSWMGGVLPEYRRHHVAKALADAQEAWAKQSGYQRIVFKTRNKHKAMLAFAIHNGFSIIGVEERRQIEEYRILLQKLL